jgi:hypothetical protein
MVSFNVWQFKTLMYQVYQLPGQAQWLTPVISATWEAEIRKIAVLRSAQAKASKTSSQPTGGCGGLHLSFQIHVEA